MRLLPVVVTAESPGLSGEGGPSHALYFSNTATETLSSRVCPRLLRCGASDRPPGTAEADGATGIETEAAEERPHLTVVVQNVSRGQRPQEGCDARAQPCRSRRHGQAPETGDTPARERNHRGCNGKEPRCACADRHVVEASGSNKLG